MSTSPKIRSYDETWDKPITSYTAVTKDGVSVVIQPKNPEHHKSSHPLDQHPTYFLNLGVALATADRWGCLPSHNPVALANSKGYDHIAYEKDNYIQSLSMPGWEDTKNEVTTIIVAIGKGKNKGNNFTRTYRSKIKRT